MSLDDSLLEYIATPALIGDKKVFVSHACVERERSRQRNPSPADHVALRLRQRIESGRWMTNQPGWLPASLVGRWSNFISCSGLLFCLVQSKEHEDVYEAVTCFEKSTCEKKVCLSTNYGQLSEEQVIVEIPDHAVERYVGRVQPGAAATARTQLGQLISEHAELLPELPIWFVGEARDDAPYYLAIAGWLVIPLRFKRESSYRYVAVTCLGRGLDELRNDAARQPKKEKKKRKELKNYHPMDESGSKRVRRKRAGGKSRPASPSSRSAWRYDEDWDED